MTRPAADKVHTAPQATAHPIVHLMKFSGVPVHRPVLRAARGRQDAVCLAIRRMDIVGPYLQAFRLLDVVPVPQQAMASRTIVYTPKVHNTPRILDKEITFLSLVIGVM